MIVIQAIDREGKKWFRTADGSWQEHRDSSCHFMTAVVAARVFKQATIADRFLSASDRMDSIEMVTLT